MIPFSVATYNIHWGIGEDNRYDLQRIASVLKKTQADIVCLQEVHKNTSRFPNDAQHEIIAQLAGYKYIAYASAMRGYPTSHDNHAPNNIGEYGISILSKFPIKTQAKTIYSNIYNLESRVALLCSVELNTLSATADLGNFPDNKTQTPPATHETIWILNTHLSADWKGAAQYGEAQEMCAFLNKQIETDSINLRRTIIVGDFNSLSFFPCMWLLDDLGWTRSIPSDTYSLMRGRVTMNEPLLGFIPRCIDYIFINKNTDFYIIKYSIIDTELALLASDHFPVKAEFIIDSS